MKEKRRFFTTGLTMLLDSMARVLLRGVSLIDELTPALTLCACFFFILFF
jgi:hypothetical protein